MASRAKRAGRSAPTVLLVSMPLASLERPSLGLSLLKARLTHEGVPCEVRYLGFRFAEFIGLEHYQFLHQGLPYTAFAGDWLFSRTLNGARPDVDARYVDEVLRRTWQLDDATIDAILSIAPYCELFLEHCLTSLPLDDVDVVGFTSTFEQNLASLALAKRIKARRPSTTIVFGGANWEGDMGQALHQQFSFVDVVCSGEADESFPAVVRAIASGADLTAIRGVVHRRDGRSVANPPAPPIGDLDALPIPDYDDYFAALQASPVAADVTPMLLLETSRGCWWGEKHHCTFCGLNGLTMAFRSKTADRVMDEIHDLRGRYGVDSLSVVDNILDMRYFRTLLPRLAEETAPLGLFYEVKANLSRERVGQLALAGIHHIQPGIESLSDHVLDLMRKGTTALQNIQLLKWCREYGIRPEWNVLYGFPDETSADYNGMLPLIDAIDFLDPPAAFGPVRLDRFSPYHDDAAGWGLVNVRPLAPYRYLYAADRTQLDRIAYYFEFDYADGHNPQDVAGPLIARVQRWMADGPRGGVWIVGHGPDAVRILVEHRSGGGEVVELVGWQARVYLACDRIQGMNGIHELVGREAGAAAIDEFLATCVAGRLMVRTDDRYLSLGVHRPALAVAMPSAAATAVELPMAVSARSS
jgi:ribosomal peptide maturation radical SAM protein 1